MLELLQRSKQSVDRTAGRVFGRDVHTDGEKAAVAPVTSTAQRDAVRLPLGEKSIDGREKRVGDRARQRLIAREHPNARRIRERVELNDWHSRNITRRQFCLDVRSANRLSERD